MGMAVVSACVVRAGRTVLVRRGVTFFASLALRLALLACLATVPCGLAGSDCRTSSPKSPICESHIHILGYPGRSLAQWPGGCINVRPSRRPGRPGRDEDLRRRRRKPSGKERPAARSERSPAFRSTAGSAKTAGRPPVPRVPRCALPGSFRLQLAVPPCATPFRYWQPQVLRTVLPAPHDRDSLSGRTHQGSRFSAA